MTKGRRPKPTMEKQLAGNPGRRPLNSAEPMPDPKKPPIPKFLKGEARKEWNRIAKRLHECGLLTYIDRGVLALYCAAWGRWVDAYEQVSAEGFEAVVVSEKGGLYQNPWVGIASNAAKDVLKFGEKLGLSPAARSAIKLPQADVEDDPFADLFALVDG